MSKWCGQITMVLAVVFVGGCVSEKSQESPMLSGIETLQEEIRWDGGHDVADYGNPEVNAAIEALLCQWFGSPVPFGAKVGASASGTNRVPIKVVKDFWGLDKAELLVEGGFVYGVVFYGDAPKQCSFKDLNAVFRNIRRDLGRKLGVGSDAELLVEEWDGHVYGRYDLRQLLRDVREDEGKTVTRYYFATYEDVEPLNGEKDYVRIGIVIEDDRLYDRIISGEWGKKEAAVGEE